MNIFAAIGLILVIGIAIMLIFRSKTGSSPQGEPDAGIGGAPGPFGPDAGDGGGGDGGD